MNYLKQSNSGFTKKRRIQRGAAGISLVLAMGGMVSELAVAQETAIQHQAQRFTLDLPPQDLANALNTFSAISRTQISAPSRYLKGKSSQLVRGEYTVAEALDILLAETGLQARKAGDNSYTIAPLKSQSPANGREDLGSMQVKGAYVVNDRLDTATGLGLTLQETPQSVSIMTAQRIEDQGLRSLRDVVNNAAGISSKALDSSRDGFSGRGYDVTNYQIDGIPVHWEGGSSAGETQLDMALYERVEIVRGATGLLTGAGNPSASINLVRKHADSKEFAGYVSVGASRWDTYTTTADVSAPINSSGSVRARTVLVYEDGDSYVDYAGNEKTVVYGVIDADLTDNTLLSFGISYQDNEPEASQWGGLPIFFSDGTRTDWSRSKTTAADWTYWATEHETYFVNLAHNFYNGWKIELNANRMVSSSEMKLLYLSGSPDPQTGLGMNASPARFDNERTQGDYGVRISGFYDLLNREHEIVFGASHSEQDFIYNRYGRTDPPAVGNFFEWDGSFPEPEWLEKSRFTDTTTEQIGYYLATRLSITDRFKTVLGTRVADWEKTDHLNDAEFGDTGVMVPYAGVLYDLTDNHTLYASYTEIFQPQDKQDENDVFLDPLTGINKEVGIKSSFFQDKLHTTVTYFQVEQENFGLLVEDELNPQNNYYIPIDGIESDGFELEVTGELAPGWKVSGNYTHFDPTADLKDSGDAKTVNTRFPRKLLRLFTTYQWTDLTLGGGVNWEGENYTEVTNPGTGETERAEQKAYTLVNLMARYQIDKNLSAQVNIDNLFDKTYYSQIGFYTQLAYGEPRNISVNLKYEF